MQPDSAFTKLFDACRRGVRVAAVARVERYDASAATADVVILVQEERLVDGERVAVDPVRVEGCPVLWPAGGGRSLTMGLAEGDKVLALVRHRSHDEIDAGESGPVQPVSTRRMNYADTVILPGYVAPADGHPSAAVKADGQPVFRLPSGEAVHVGASTATYVLVRWDSLQGFLSTLKTWLDSHFHTHFMGPTGTPATAPSPTAGDLSSSRVKVDA